ncbi:MAG TPA: hypothetical protein VGD37_36670 [Kofleriaceae bacterium]|jgi:predicted regulator of Ras-like GTPase activity (Roadblock/LC7/MglB family)
MLEPILQNLREVNGVQGAMVVDSAAVVLAYRAHAIYDFPVLQQVARSIINAADSIQLIQDEWDVLTAHFGEGKLLLRSLRTATGKPRRYVLAVLADSTLNVAFLGVALRVAAAKLIAELESPPPGAQNTAVPVAIPSSTTGRFSLPEQSRSTLAKAGLSWSTVTSGSAVGGSDVVVADTASSTFLSACAKSLAASIGPMAKVLVKEAVRKVCGERPFSRSDGPAVLAQLTAGIDDSDDRAAFQRATSSL